MFTGIYKILFLSALIVGGRGNNASNTFKSRDYQKTVTIIFNGFIPSPQSVKLGEGISVNNVAGVLVIWDSFHKTDISSDSISFNDTLHYELSGDLVLVQHKFQGISSTDYLLKAGDTLKISFKDSVPNGELTNSTIDSAEKIISQKLRESSLSNDKKFSAYEIYTYPFVGLSLYDPKFSLLTGDKKLTAFHEAKKCFANERTYLDSLKDRSLLSDEQYLMFSNRAYYLSNLLDLEQDELTEDSIRKIISGNKFFSPGLPYSYLQDFLEALVLKKIVPRVKRVRSGSGSVVDYRQVYDEIEKDHIYFMGKYKDLLLLKYLTLVADNFSTPDFKFYANKFFKTVSSSYLTNEIYKQYFIDFDDLRLLRDSLYLINGKKEKLTFAALLSKSKSKLIYVDFWASWCIPCREAMPESKLLREKYKGKEISFVYLSIDRSFDAWQKASAFEKLNTYPENYLVVNPSTSGYLKNLKVEDIPRYLLFRRDGTLEDAHAPDPGSNELHKRIEKMLFKK